MKISRTWAANLALLCAAMLWGGGFVASKVALRGWKPFVVLTLRFGSAAVLFGLLFYRRIAHAPKATVRKGCIIGGLFTAAFGIHMVGLQYTTSAKVSFLCTAYVVLVPFISWAILKKRPDIRAIAAGFLAFAGIGFISLNEALSISFGDLLSLLYNLPYGLALVLIALFSDKDTDTFQITFYQFLTIAACSFVICLTTGADFHCRDTTAIPGLIYLVTLNTIVAMLLQNIAQRHVKASAAALLISMESVFGFCFSVLYFHDSITVRLLIGSSLCFIAILISNYGKKKDE